MSTKTLRKRVALATVVAVSAGLLSLVSTTSAQAAAGDGSNTGTSTLNATPTDSNLYIATKPGLNASVGAVGTASVTAATSLGLITFGDLLGGVSTGLLGTVTALNTGVIGFYTKQSSHTILAKLTNGLMVKDGKSANMDYNGDITQAATNSYTNDDFAGFAVKPASGATSTIVKLYVDATTTDTSTALFAGTNAGALTLVSQYTITWVASSTSGTYSAAKSGVWYTGAVNSTGLTSDSVTLASPGSASYKDDLYANIRVRDAYGNALTGAGLLQASATNGATVGLGTTAAGAVAANAASSTAFVAIGTGNPADNYVLDVEAPASAPVSTVVTISYNGTVIGTKSFTFTGNVAKIVLSSPTIGKTGGTGKATIAFLDSAGNTITSSTSGFNSAYFSQDATSFNNYLTAVTLSTAPATGVVGKITFNCGANAGTANVDVKYTNADATVITSNALAVACAGASTTYTAAYDKTSYHPGDVATLIVTFKDSKGNLANDVDTQTATTAASVSVAGFGSSGVIVGPSSTVNTDISSGGVIKYTYSVGSTTGTFTNTVNFPDVNTAAKAASLTPGPVTATLTIADGATSLNDVLKGIVSLIASINKQIAALAKLVAPAKKK
jgi:hypothetical protein